MHLDPRLVGTRRLMRLTHTYFTTNQSEVYSQTDQALFESLLGFPGGSDSKVSAYNAGDPGSIPGSGRSSGKGDGTPLQYSCLENPMDRGAW